MRDDSLEGMIWALDKLECDPVQEGTRRSRVGLSSQSSPLQGWGHRGQVIPVP